MFRHGYNVVVLFTAETISEECFVYFERATFYSNLVLQASKARAHHAASSTVLNSAGRMTSSSSQSSE